MFVGGGFALGVGTDKVFVVLVLFVLFVVVGVVVLFVFGSFVFSGATVFGKGVGEFGVHGQRHSNRRDQASGGKDTELD